jgi:predicted Zn-dependent protease
MVVLSSRDNWSWDLTRPGGGPVNHPARDAGTTSTPPSTEDAYESFRRAETFFEAGRPNIAADLLIPVLAAEPTNVAALELLARAYLGSAQLNRAEQTLRRLVDLAPADAWARFALARALERRSLIDEAASHRRIAAALGLEA